LTCALYYKEVGRPLPLDHFMMTVWTPWADPASHQAAREALKIFPEFRMTDRRNTDIGNQFTYLWGLHTEETIFGFAAQFSKSYFVMGAAVAPSLYEGSPGWTQHSADEEKLEVFLAKPSDYGIGRSASPCINGGATISTRCATTKQKIVRPIRYKWNMLEIT